MLQESYDLLNELMQNPAKYGAFLVLKKIKNPKGKIPLNIKLFDFKREIDKEIKELSYKILGKIGFFDLPDGSK